MTKVNDSTTKELIEQEAGKPIIIEAYNDDGTHSHWRLIDPATGDLIWTQSPEEDTHLWTGKVPFTTFALSLPKQDTSLYKKQPMYKVILQNDTYTYVLIEQMLTPDEYPYCQKYELYSKGFVPKCYPTLEADKDYWASNVERSLQDGEFYINENGCAMPPKQDNGDAWDEVEIQAKIYADSTIKIQDYTDDSGFVDVNKFHYLWLRLYNAYLKQHYSISKIK